VTTQQTIPYKNQLPTAKMPKPPAEFADRDDIDPKKWGKKPNLNNPDDLNEETINGYILYCWNYYKGKYDESSFGNISERTLMGG
jgi:hypothetical protein